MRASIWFAAAIATSVPLVGQEPQPIGADFQVNSYTTNYQDNSAVSVGPSGEFVVVWNSLEQDGAGNGVFGQRFSANAAPTGNEFQVNTSTMGGQGVTSGAVAALPGGGFVVVWSSQHVPASEGDIYARLYNSAGSPTGAEFAVNTYSTGGQWSALVSANDDGDFVVAWNSYGQDGDGVGVFGQRFDANGNPAGPEFRANNYTPSGQIVTGLTTAPDGGVVVSWMSAGQDGSGYGVFGRVFDENNNPQGGDFQVNSYTTGYQINGVAAPGENGDFVAALDPVH